MREVALSINGIDFIGWETIRITTSLEAFCGSFSLSVSDSKTKNEMSLSIKEGDECKIKIGEEIIITGYVDLKNISLTDSDHVFEVSGRDKTSDLIDCSAVLSAWQFDNISVLEIAKKVAMPFGVKVALDKGLSLSANPPSLVVNPGESAYEVIDKAARLAGFFVISDNKGGLLFTKAGNNPSASSLNQSENILAISVNFDSASCFRKYIVIGQSIGSDDTSGEEASDVKGIAFDMNVSRASRVFMIQAEGAVTQKQAQDRAQWEAAVRRAAALTVNVTVQGWAQVNGNLWKINCPVTLNCPVVGMTRDMLISQVVFNLTNAGTTTDLILRPKDSFLPKPVIQKEQNFNQETNEDE